MEETMEQAAPASGSGAGGASGRLTSIDALRGFDMFWIIGGGELLAELANVWPNRYTFALRDQLEHVPWGGCHLEDLIYPLFLFIIGLVLPFSLGRRRERGEGVVRLSGHILLRSVLLVILGSIPGGLLSFTHWPFLGGVLAHIGICYFFAALVVLVAGWRIRAAIVAGWLVVYWLASLLIPVPGHGRGVFTEAGSLASYVDGLIITGKLWNEGPSSTPSGVVLILWGSLAGEWLRAGSRSGNAKAMGLVLAGVLALVLGYVWSFSFPMIKRVVWSSSYVTWAGGWSLVLLAGFYWVIDVLGWRRWSFFFVVIGMNAITIYFLQSIVDFGQIAKVFVQGLSAHGGTFSPLVLPAGELGVKWLLLWFLYRHKIFFKL